MKIPDFKIKPTKDADGKENEMKSNQEIALDVFLFAVANTYTKDNGQKGRESTLSGTQGRMWGRIQRKMDDVIDEKSSEVVFETSEVDFLKKAIDGAAFPTIWFKWTSLLQDELDVKVEKEDKKKE